MTGTAIRRIVIEQSKRANVGHIGSALSVADIVAALYGGVLRVPAPRAHDRDRFVLAKGHAVLAVYAALFLRGWLDQAALDSYCGAVCGERPAARVRRAHRLREGCLVHGGSAQVALLAHV